MISWLIIAIAVLLIIGVIKFILSKPIVRDNISSRSYKTVGLLILIIAVGAIIYIVLFSTKLFIDKNGEENFPEALVTLVELVDTESNNDKEIIIEIHADRIKIGGRTYHDIASVESIIESNESSDICITLIDNYAYADTYISVRNMILEHNIEPVEE